MYSLLIAINDLDDYTSNRHSGDDIESETRALVAEFEEMLHTVHFDLEAVSKFVEAVEIKCPFAMNRLRGPSL
jgi:hypothetical protein